MLAEIITIGDEILIGQIVDSNSAWIAQQLNRIGVQLGRITSIADKGDAICKTLEEASSRADVVLCTGGLGPTRDDVTKQALASYFQTGLHRDQQVLEHVTRFFERMGRPMLESNTRQADVLDNAEVLFNEVGTAPGMAIQHYGTYFFIMPGVPSEMKYLMTNEVLPRLKELPGESPIAHQTILTAGIGESFLSELLQPFENALPPHVHLAYLPKYGQVRLRLTAVGPDEQQLVQQLDECMEMLIARVGNYAVARGDEPLEQHILNALEHYGLRLSTAESCTGGYLAHLVTKLPGSSKVFVGGAVSYSNALKMEMLGVDGPLLEAYGAVSEETVRAMANGAKERFGSDYAVATTGVAGPGGGTAQNPVGTVWIGVAGRHKTVAKKIQLGKARDTNIERAAAQALLYLYLLMKEEL